jgi:hypothetical protein
MGRTSCLLFFHVTLTAEKTKTLGAGGQTHRQQEDLISLLTNISGDIKTNKPHGGLINLKN